MPIRQALDELKEEFVFETLPDWGARHWKGNLDRAKASSLLIIVGVIVLAGVIIAPLVSDFNAAPDSAAILMTPADYLIQPQMTQPNIELVEEILKNLSGYNSTKEKRFLILSQDPLEMRPTGGFAGTYSEITVNNGELIKMKYDDIWKLDKQLKKEGVLQINQSQWWTHFPRTAQQAMSSYKKATGVELDGVIAMDPTAMSYILEIIGPIKVKKFNEVVDSKNLLDKVLKYSPYVKDKVADTPLHKVFLSEAAREIQQKLFSLDIFNKRKELSKAILKSLEEKHMLIFFKESASQKILSEHNWAGELRNTAGDFLSVIDYNAGINKVNIFVDRQVKYHADVLEDGRVIGNLKVNYFYDTSKTAYKKYGRLYSSKFYVYRNIQRVYLPEGAKLLSAKNYDGPIEKSVEDGKTAFKSMFTLRQGEKREFKIKYELPSIKKGQYSLLIQKQPGTPIDKESEYAVSAQISLPRQARADAYFPIYEKFKSNKFSFKSISTNDMQIVINFTI